MKKAIYVSAAVVLLLGFGMFYFGYIGSDSTNVNNNTNLSSNTNAVFCTEDAKICPDGTAVGRTAPNCEFPECPEVDSLLTETEARAIAEASCIKGGESLAAGIYNKNTQTWWYDANLNSTREGCSPACVVSEQTETAEINWRCTGLVVPE